MILKADRMEKDLADKVEEIKSLISFNMTQCSQKV
jgi:hypothetical protein